VLYDADRERRERAVLSRVFDRVSGRQCRPLGCSLHGPSSKIVPDTQPSASAARRSQARLRRDVSPKPLAVAAQVAEAGRRRIIVRTFRNPTVRARSQRPRWWDAASRGIRDEVARRAATDEDRLVEEWRQYRVVEREGAAREIVPATLPHAVDGSLDTTQPAQQSPSAIDRIWIVRYRINMSGRLVLSSRHSGLNRGSGHE